MAIGVVEIASATVNSLIRLSGTDSEFAKALQEYLFYLELLSLSGELTVAIKEGLRKSAKKALKEQEDILKLQKNARNVEEITEIENTLKHLNEVAELERDIAKFTIENKGKNITLKQFNKVAKRIFKAHGVRLHLVESGKLFDLWKKDSVFATFQYTKHINTRYKTLLDGPAIYIYKGINDAGRNFKVSSYTLQHELFHLELWVKMVKKYPNLAPTYFKIPNWLHEADVIGNFVKQNKVGKISKWDLDDVLDDINTLNDNLKNRPIWKASANQFGIKKFALSDFDNWDINIFLHKLQ